MKTFSNLDYNEQVVLFDKVKELKRSGLCYKRIIKRIKIEADVRLSLGTLSYWFNNDVKMLGGENQFKEEPSKELAYVLGVMFGDGCLNLCIKNQDYNLQLVAKDRDFVEKFSRDGSTLLKKERPYSVCIKNRIGYSTMYSTQIRSKQLYYFIKSIKEDFEKGKPFIEKFPAEFVQGLADSEGSAIGCVSKTFRVSVDVANSANLRLLEYVEKLLVKRFKIKSCLRKVKSAGESDSIIDGRIITRTKNVYRLTVRRFEDVVKYSNLIGFGIGRKETKLIDSIFLLKKFGSRSAGDFWKKIYYKEGRYWIRSNNIRINKLQLSS